MLKQADANGFLWGVEGLRIRQTPSAFICNVNGSLMGSRELPAPTETHCFGLQCEIGADGKSNAPTTFHMNV
eukprot:4743293-Pyramimonas_sp.AAC.1